MADYLSGKEGLKEHIKSLEEQENKNKIIINLDAPGITNAIELNAKSNKQIAKSNKQIAMSILTSAQMMLTGLGSIANEMECKRKTDEYFMLMDKIMLLEDRFISMKKDLNEIYDKVEISYENPIELTRAQFLILAKIFQDQKSKEYILVSNNPWEAFCEIYNSLQTIIVYGTTRKVALQFKSTIIKDEIIIFNDHSKFGPIYLDNDNKLAWFIDKTPYYLIYEDGKICDMSYQKLLRLWEDWYIDIPKQKYGNYRDFDDIDDTDKVRADRKKYCAEQIRKGKEKYENQKFKIKIDDNLKNKFWKNFS